MLKRIADDRRTQQEKTKPGTPTDPSPPDSQGQKLGGGPQTSLDNNCILMVSLVLLPALLFLVLLLEDRKSTRLNSSH